MNLTIMPNLTAQNPKCKNVQQPVIQQPVSFKSKEDVALVKCLFEIAQAEKNVNLYEIYKSILSTLRFCGVETKRIFTKNKSLTFSLNETSGQKIGRLSYSKDNKALHTRRIDYIDAENSKSNLSLVKDKDNNLK